MIVYTDKCFRQVVYSGLCAHVGGCSCVAVGLCGITALVIIRTISRIRYLSSEPKEVQTAGLITG